MRACVKSQLGQSESGVASSEPCPVVYDRPRAQVVPVAVAHTVLEPPVEGVFDGAVWAVLKDHHSRHS